MTTNEIAEAILADTGDLIFIPEALQGKLVPDLRAMARLWLMKDEIEGYLYSSNDIEPSGTVSALLAKLRALETGER